MTFVRTHLWWIVIVLAIFIWYFNPGNIMKR